MQNQLVVRENRARGHADALVGVREPRESALVGLATEEGGNLEEIVFLSTWPFGSRLGTACDQSRLLC